jgi:hypothetical protein
MTRVIFAVPLLLAFAAAPLSLALADTKPANHHAKRTPARVVQQQKVACTKLGCFPIAPNCTPYGQLDWRGNPTGYDGIACR